MPPNGTVSTLEVVGLVKLPAPPGEVATFEVFALRGKASAPINVSTIEVDALVFIGQEQVGVESALAFEAVLGAAVKKNVIGATTPAALIRKRSGLATAGALASDAAVTIRRFATRQFQGEVTPDSDVSPKVAFGRIFSGALTSGGAVAKAIGTRKPQGTIAPIGVFVRHAKAVFFSEVNLLGGFTKRPRHRDQTKGELHTISTLYGNTGPSFIPVEGAVGPQGSLNKASPRRLVAALTFAGHLPQKFLRSLVASIAPVGLFRRMARRPVGGVLVPDGLLGALQGVIRSQAIEGLVTLAGTVIDRFKPGFFSEVFFEADLEASGGRSRSLTGRIRPARHKINTTSRRRSYVKVSRNVGSVLMPAGVAYRSFHGYLVAALDFVAEAPRYYIKRRLTAVLDLTRLNRILRRKTFTTGLRGTLINTAEVGKGLSLGFDAVVGFTVASMRKALVVKDGALGTAGGLWRKATRPVVATVGFVGGLQRVTSRQLAGAVGLAGAWVARVRKFLIGGILMPAEVERVRHIFVSTDRDLGFWGGFRARPLVVLAGVVGVVGVVRRQVGTLRIAVLDLGASLNRKMVRSLAGEVGLTRAFAWLPLKRLTGALSSSNDMIRHVQRRLVGVLRPASSQRRFVSFGLTSALDFTAIIRRRIPQRLGSILTFVQIPLVRRTRLRLQAFLDANALVNRRIQALRVGAVSFASSVRTRARLQLQSLLSFSSRMNFRIPQHVSGVLDFAGEAVRRQFRQLWGLLSGSSLLDAIATWRNPLPVAVDYWDEAPDISVITPDRNQIERVNAEVVEVQARVEDPQIAVDAGKVLSIADGTPLVAVSYREIVITVDVSPYEPPPPFIVEAAVEEPLFGMDVLQPMDIDTETLKDVGVGLDKEEEVI